MSKISGLCPIDLVLPGRAAPILSASHHVVLNQSLFAPFPNGYEKIILAMGCFWGVERLFWTIEGVYVTAVGYIGGQTKNPTYEEVCTGRTNHTEGVLVVYDPQKVALSALLKVFWENHDPTQGFRQGGDVGSQYRSAIYCTTDAQQDDAIASKEAYQAQLSLKSLPAITTEIAMAPEFYYAEDYHQGYLHKNPRGYCGIKGLGVVCPI